MACLVTGEGGLSKCSRTIYYKTLAVANFVKTCCLISIYNDMLTVYSYDTPQRTGQTD